MLRQVTVPAWGQAVSNLMGAPSSSEPETHEQGLEVFHALGGNCLHLHGEGGETESRQVTGQWLRQRGLRRSFFLCSQICHDGWDEANHRPIDRFTAEAVSVDLAVELELLGTDYLDLVYLDDSAGVPVEPIIDALGREVRLGRLLGFGVRNWSSDRICAANAYATRTGQARITAMVTTEMALAKPTDPLWPEYLPFDEVMVGTATSSGMAVLSHVGDLNLGQVLFGDEDRLSRGRVEWVERWSQADNAGMIQRVEAYASRHGLTPREVNIAYVLNQPFPVIGIVSLPTLLGRQRKAYERASTTMFEAADRGLLQGVVAAV